MSDYMFMLENHLNSHQSRALDAVCAAAAETGTNVFLTGGAVRDMMGGFPIRDLDFTVEGPALKIAKSAAARANGNLLYTDEHRKSAEILYPGGVTVEIGMARLEKFGKPGARPQVTPATIHEDLRGRDFSINALALSLNKASRGLLLDPTNGLSDLEAREIRAVSNYGLYDNPIRLLRLIRLQVRLGFQIAERTQSAYENARQAEMERYIPPRALYMELVHIALEPNPADVLAALEKENLIQLFSPALTGPKLNLAGFQKLQKVRQLLPFGIDIPTDQTALFLNLLTEKLAPKERTALAQATAMDKPCLDSWQKLEARAKKAEKDLQSAKLQKPSNLYQTAVKIPGEQLLYLLMKSTQRVVVDRLKNYFGKYLPMAVEVADQEIEALGHKPGTPKFEKVKAEKIAARLDARPKKVAPPPGEVEMAEVAVAAAAPVAAGRR